MKASLPKRSALGLAVLFCTACGSPAPPPNTAASAEPPTEPDSPKRALLWQPVLARAGQEATAQGTGFVVRNRDGNLFGITSAHFVGFEGPALQRVDLLSVAGEEVLAQASTSWGRPGVGGVDEPLTDLGDDLLALPLGGAPAGIRPVAFAEAIMPEAGQRVWLPNKDDSEPSGYRRVGGVITEVDLGYVAVRLDEEVALSSQSGSPVLSEGDDTLVGVLSRGGGEEGAPTRLWLTPARYVDTLVNTAHDVFPLAAVAGAGAIGDKATLQFGWPRQGALRMEKWHVKKKGSADPRAATSSFQLALSPREGGGLRVAVEAIRSTALDTAPAGVAAQVAALADVAPASLVAADGSFEGIEDPQPVIERIIAAAGQMTEDQQKAVRATLTPAVLQAAVSGDWAKRVSMWAGGSLDIGDVYVTEAEGAFPLTGDTIPTRTYFAVTHRTACTPDDAQRSCVAIWARIEVDPEALARSVKNLILRTAPEEQREKAAAMIEGMQLRSAVRIWLVTDPRTLVPHEYMREKHVVMPGQPDNFDALRERLLGVEP